MTTSTQKLLRRVLELSQDSISLNECELALAAPRMAKALEAAVEALKDATQVNDLETYHRKILNMSRTLVEIETLLTDSEG